MAAADEPTLGEIWRLVSDIKKSQAQLAQKIDSLSFVRIDVWTVEKERIDDDITGLGQRLDAAVKTVSDDLKKTQDALRWLVYTVAGTIIALGLGAAFAAASR